MNKDNNTNKPLIGFSMGDLNGVGPELLVDTLSDQRLLEKFTPIIYASGRLFAKYRKILKNNNFNYNQINDTRDVKTGKINILNLWNEEVDIKFGHITEEGGKYALMSLQKGVQELAAKRVDALVTCPINKDNIQSDDFNFPGHTDFITKEAGAKESLMLLTSEDVKVGVVTDHIPLKEVANHLSKEKIVRKAEIFLETLHNDFAVERPRLALLGLNPHAGDNGLLGSEEKDIIIPAINDLKEKNHLVFGPYSPDGFFGNYEFKNFDGVLAMYHDQGLIPFKTLAFGKGVNYTAGINIIRTSPDHGTAYAIAGKGVVNTSSFLQSIYTAIDIFNARKRNPIS